MVTQASSIIPSLRYRDAAAAIDWLERAFGLERRAVHAGDDGTIVHAELTLGGGMVMLGSERDGDGGFGSHAGHGWQYVVVDDPDARFARAVAAGAQVVRELEDQPYGSRDFSVRDLEGNLWSFGTYDPWRS
jgi:uncharacterized glyoxalase superfamily protein PhnB